MISNSQSKNIAAYVGMRTKKGKLGATIKPLFGSSATLKAKEPQRKADKAHPAPKKAGKQIDGGMAMNAKKKGKGPVDHASASGAKRGNTGNDRTHKSFLS